MTVHLREITPGNRAAVEALAVSPEQDRFVGNVAVTLRKAAGTPTRTATSCRSCPRPDLTALLPPGRRSGRSGR